MIDSRQEQDCFSPHHRMMFDAIGETSRREFTFIYRLRYHQEFRNALQLEDLGLRSYIGIRHTSQSKL